MIGIDSDTKGAEDQSSIKERLNSKTNISKKSEKAEDELDRTIRSVVEVSLLDNY